MKDTYIFPAIFDYADDGISIEFPDLPGCLSCADTTNEAVENANEALMLHLYGMEQDNEDIPEATAVNEIKVEANQEVILIDVFMPPFREKHSVLAWDSDFTKVTPEERKRIDKAEASGFIDEEEIDWDSLEKYADE